MAEEESPFIEEGTEPKEEAPDTDNLLDELKAAGVTNTEQLQNKLKASSESGHLAYLLGEERREKAELAKNLEELRSKPVSEDNSTDYGQPVDLQGEIRKAFRMEKEEERKQMAVAQQNMMAAWNTIQNDEDFHLVKPVWEEKLKDPNFVFSIQSGQVNPVDEYQKTLRKFYKGIVARSAETIEKLSGGKVKTPVVEQDANLAAAVEDEDRETNKELETYQKKVNKGGQLTEAEELAALQAAFSSK